MGEKNPTPSPTISLHPLPSLSGNVTDTKRTQGQPPAVPDNWDSRSSGRGCEIRTQKKEVRVRDGGEVGVEGWGATVRSKRERSRGQRPPGSAGAEGLRLRGRASPPNSWKPGSRGGRRLVWGRGYGQWGVGSDGGREKLTGEEERGLLKTSQCITQNVRVYSFILGFAGTENPEQKCHRLSCLITCCLLTPSLQGACLNLPLGPQGTRKQKTSPSPSLGSRPRGGPMRDRLHSCTIGRPEEPQSDPSCRQARDSNPSWSYQGGHLTKACLEWLGFPGLSVHSVHSPPGKRRTQEGLCGSPQPGIHQPACLNCSRHPTSSSGTSPSRPCLWLWLGSLSKRASLVV